MATTRTETAAACAECGKPLIAGLNTDFCSAACDELWTTAHTWPCERCDDEGMVADFVDGHRVHKDCPQCHGDLSYVDNDRRHCGWRACEAEAQAGQDFCGNHLALVQGVTAGVAHTHGR